MFQSSIAINEYIKFHYFVPGKVENWVILNNLGNVSVFKIPFGVLKELSKILEQNYRTRLFRVYLVNAPFTLKLLFDFFKTFDKNIQKKIHVNSKNFVDVMFDHIEKDQIESKFGGTMNNFENDFFPPKI